MLFRTCFCLILTATALLAQGGRGGVVAANGRGGAPSAGQPGAPPPPPSDCAASGTVVNALTGEPIPRAMVTLGRGDAAGASTDASGNWSITNTICGRFQPTATRPGFVAPNQSLNVAALVARMVQLTSGTPVTNIKIQLMPAGAIAGTVRDSFGDPVEGAQIRVMRVVVQAGKRIVQPQGGTNTDPDGNFRLATLESGKYLVCADSQRTVFPVGGGEALIFREACFPGPIDTAALVSLKVDPGRESRVSFTLTPSRGVHIRGTVSGMSMEPGPNGIQRFANAQLLRVQGNGISGGGRGGQVQRDGTFDIPAVQPGSYIVRVNQPVTGPGPANNNFAQASVEVGNSDVDNVLLAFKDGGTLSGAVRFELTNPASSNTSNPNINVNLQPGTPGTPMFGPIPQAKWDATHTGFTFENVPAGQYRLNANVAGGGAAFGGAAMAGGGGGAFSYIKSATLHGQDVTNQPFNLDGTAGPIEVVVSDDAGGVDVTVNDSDGHPVAAGVLLLSASGQRRILQSHDDGHATAKNLPTGDYRAWAFDDVNSVPYLEPDWMTQNAGPGEKVTITTAGNISLTVKKSETPPE